MQNYSQSSNGKVSNGRVDIMNKQPDLCNLFAMYDKIPANQCSTFREPTLGQWIDTDLSKTFFSHNNIKILQNGIRAGVYDASNGQYTIGEQDCDSLKIIMRSVFLQHSANQPTNISGQVKELNQIVLDYCVHAVYSEAQGYMKYLRDVSTLVVPLANPIQATQFDRKDFKLKPWF
jgi:hypothetical protein